MIYSRIYMSQFLTKPVCEARTDQPGHRPCRSRFFAVHPIYSSESHMFSSILYLDMKD